MLTDSQKIGISLAIVVTYYFFIKKHLFLISARIAYFFNFMKAYNQQTAAGMMEIFLASFSHLAFILLLLKFLPLAHYPQFINSAHLNLLAQGILLGLACMSFSAFLCQISIDLIQKALGVGSINQWLTISRGGWLRHHLQLLDSVPFYLAFGVIGLQIACEEFFFRGILIGFLQSMGSFATIFISTLLFVVMQAFHTPNILTASFPMIGALVMGLVFGILYIHLPFILPLIIAHLTYFLIAVL